jgi:hypothetical protein
VKVTKGVIRIISKIVLFNPRNYLPCAFWVRAMANLRGGVECYQPFYVVLIGHRHRDRRRIKFNRIVRPCQVKFKSSTKTSSGEGDLSLEEEETLEADELSSRQSGDERPSSTIPDVFISRIAAVGSFGLVLVMFVE